MRYAVLLVFLFLACFNPSGAMAQEKMVVATYNIRFDNPGDDGNLWKDRSSHLINLIRFHQIGLFGTQEGLSHQLKDMEEALGFPYIGVGRDQGGEEGEFSAIFYDPEQFTLLEEGNFWLSETPEKPSKGWDAALNRICTWGKFQKGEAMFYVFNVHFDHVGQQAREESSKLIVRKINELNIERVPTILMGDFNVEDDNPAYAAVMDSKWLIDTKNKSKIPPYGPSGTFNAFDWEMMPDRRIDYVFVSPEFEVKRYGVLSDHYGKKYPSDHFPVLVDLEIKP
ncbi:endonuclease/exonuclease/phosphatase family protein [Pararhodonellum marinum]|uniref:endonuclease/exonuclease/phosphatase family protein n=1 Tax=Pararhodonellum marinum TaxID=2755358 RepID=UPI00189029B8|nr:endonuclease/exonuclease/phosphatase family protein [Pararhodonellum marinum]